MLVGITCGFEVRIDRRNNPAPRYVCSEDYVTAVEHAGAAAVLLPYVSEERAPMLLDELDGLVISGSEADVPPEYFGEEPHAGLGKLDRKRSAFERQLCLLAIERDLPLLGVCGGMQLLNVALGGTLYQDLGECPGAGKHEQPHDRRQPHHAVDLVAGSRLAEICGAQTLQVNSTHHQAVRALGKGVAATAVAPDGVIEAIEVAGKRFALGVQWHPESLDAFAQRAIYEALIRAL